MTEVELSAGSIRYEDTGGEGPVVVLCHGLLMTASLWDAVVAELGPGFGVFGPPCRWAPTDDRCAGGRPVAAWPGSAARGVP